MPNESHISGNANIVIQGVTDSTITVNVNGESQEISKKLDALLEQFAALKAQTIQVGDNLYNVGSITQASLGFILGQAGHGNNLPQAHSENLTNENLWIKSLSKELLKIPDVSVGNKPTDVFQHYGWLVETFLLKMSTPTGRGRTLERLSFMAEAFQSTLRYLCYIQVAQLLQGENRPEIPQLTSFLKMEGDAHDHYDYLLLLVNATAFIPLEQAFVPEIHKFVDLLSHPETDTDTNGLLHSTAIFLQGQRNSLIKGLILQEEQLEKLLDEYLTGLVYWLRKLSFLAKYRLISMKDINLSYRLGTAKTFVHLYGELHGMYAEGAMQGEDYTLKAIQDVFTYNQSVLLLKGTKVDDGLANIRDVGSYLSLSPLIIDNSVWADSPKQTPDIYYFIGQGGAGSHYRFAEYKNELSFPGKKESPKTWQLLVREQNNDAPKLDELYEQLNQLLKPWKSSRS